MLILSLLSLSFSGIAWKFKLLPKTQKPAYGIINHLPVHFKRPVFSALG